MPDIIDKIITEANDEYLSDDGFSYEGLSMSSYVNLSTGVIDIASDMPFTSLIAGSPPVTPTEDTSSSTSSTGAPRPSRSYASCYITRVAGLVDGDGEDILLYASVNAERPSIEDPRIEDARVNEYYTAQLDIEYSAYESKHLESKAQSALQVSTVLDNTIKRFISSALEETVISKAILSHKKLKQDKLSDGNKSSLSPKTETNRLCGDVSE